MSSVSVYKRAPCAIAINRAPSNLMLVLITVLALGAIMPQAAADTFTWDGNGGAPPSGAFGAAVNWNPNQVPGLSDTALFNLAATYEVSYAYNPTNADLLFQNGQVAFVSSGAKRLYSLSNDALITGGQMNLNGLDLTAADDLLVDGATMFVDAGAFGSSTATSWSCSVGDSGTGQLTVQNAGQLVSDRYGFIGRNGGANGTVTIDGPSASWVNNGDIRIGELGTGLLNVQNGASASSI
ncbi:MAG: hypothetical protein HQ546_05165 [Planctomycetes bacterium]|nr:hypothetical protein [Planctomycetota bacterium]